MTFLRFVAFVLLLALVEPQVLQAQAAPKLVSVAPLGGQRGTKVDLVVRGAGLEGVSVVWLGPGSKLDSLKSPLPFQVTIPTTKGLDGIEAHVQVVPGGSRAKVRLMIAPDARVGFHALSLISPRGLSGSIAFWIGPDAVIQELATAHNTPETAQSVKLPLAVNGRISEAGQLDYYAFDITREETVTFEMNSIHGVGFDPQLALYESGGSYLDPRRSRRLLFHEEVTQGGMPASRRMTYHFTKPGRYLVNIGTVFSQGGGDFSYLLRIAAVEKPAGVEDALPWARRRLHELSSRTVGTPVAEIELVKDAEPNDDPAQATAFSVPAVLEGTIGRPGDIDHFRFKAKAAQKLAFEIQTPRASSPQFNPRLDILDPKGGVVLTNLRAQDGKIGTVDAKVFQVAPEVLGKLDLEGEYSVRVRDLTSVHGSPDHAYRVLVRQQIPHVGDIRVQPEGPINLHPGARQRLTLNAPGKEDYAGVLALSVDGLPQGVKAFVAANGATIELVADPGAPCSLMPQMLRISGLVLVAEKSGAAFQVGDIPVMVVKK